jgi:hypothetical protein
MAEAPTLEALPEQQLNELLRRADWRFLLRQAEAPLIADLTSGRDSTAIGLVGRGEPVPGAADVAVIGYPTKLALRGAVDSLRLGGEVVCLWRVPRPGASRRAAARLRRAGLTDVRVFWPGPAPRHSPQFWLQLDSPATAAHLLAQRPPGSAAQAALRPLWRSAARLGLLAPLCAIGRLPAGKEETEADEIDAAFPAGEGQLLLSGGRRSINKVVGLSFSAGVARPSSVVKFSRVPTADEALEREASVLRSLERERPAVTGVPRLLAQGQRAGRTALAESAVFGEPLISALSPERFGELTGLVGEWLVGLAESRPRPRDEWWQRLVGEPLAEFERNFGAVAAEAATRARQRLEGLGELPGACEHRDCSPWNVVLGDDGTTGLLDWESAEPRGLPGLDLAYFLANAAFILDGALESGRTRESYARLLDPSSRYGAVAAHCAADYCKRLDIAGENYSRLRLLCWVVHSRSDRRHLSMAAAGSPSAEALRSSSFLALIEEELDRPTGT